MALGGIMRKNLQSYRQVDVNSNVLSADPHIIISMLYTGIFDSLAIAKGGIERKDLELKSKSLSKAINILQSLQYSLDFDSRPEISKNLNDFYQVCIDKLTQASTNLSISEIDETIQLMMPLADAWRNIPESDKQEGFELLSKKQAS